VEAPHYYQVEGSGCDRSNYLLLMSSFLVPLVALIEVRWTHSARARLLVPGCSFPIRDL
jgi:hypothetical protein